VARAKLQHTGITTGAGRKTGSDIVKQLLDNIIAAAKANPGKLTVGTAGHGSPQHLAVAAFAAAAGIQLSYVPFKGAAPALVATVGRHVDVVAPGVSEAITLNERLSIALTGANPHKARAANFAERGDTFVQERA